MIYDRNPAAQLVLDDTRYRPMSAGDRDVALAPCDRFHLKQRHYVARSTPAGLTVSTEPQANGWERLEETAWMDQKR